MKRGLFTGKKVGDYLRGTNADYYNARRVINGTDHASEIMGDARKFENILKGAQESVTSLLTVQHTDVSEVDAPEQEVSQSIIGNSLVAPSSGVQPLAIQPQAIQVQAIATDKSTSKKSLWGTITGGISIPIIASHFDDIQRASDVAKGLPHSNTLLEIALAGVLLIIAIYLLRQFVNGIFDRWSAHKLNELQLKGGQDPKLQTAELAPPPVHIEGDKEPAV
jgi:hypothetical protein